MPPKEMHLPYPFPELQRNPTLKTGKPGKVHIVIGGIALHDHAQGTPPEGRWPWKGKPVERVTNADWTANPCGICEDALNGDPLRGYV